MMFFLFKIKSKYLFILLIVAFVGFGVAYVYYGKKAGILFLSNKSVGECQYKQKKYPRESSFRDEEDCIVCVCRGDGTLKCVKDNCSDNENNREKNADEDCDLCEQQ